MTRRRRYCYVEMSLAPGPAADPYTIRATCLTCAEQSPEPEPSESITDQHQRAQRSCTSHAARDHSDGRHLRYTARVTLRWLVTPGENIGPIAP